MNRRGSGQGRTVKIDLSSRATRDAITFLIGAGGAIWQMVHPTPYSGPILLFCAGCMGIPAALQAAQGGRKEDPKKKGDDNRAQE